MIPSWIEQCPNTSKRRKNSGAFFLRGKRLVSRMFFRFLETGQTRRLTIERRAGWLSEGMRFFSWGIYVWKTYRTW